ncbi:plasmid replication DNA-binding protein [Psychrobacter alimentarius]|uniref:plasmid replication DNA-binding protein n=1 Tax=Psychrobacter alimentarius TaxID=261164 RepID=UPI003FD60AA1
MNISVTKAAKEWGVSRTTIYQKINDGELSRTVDKKIDVSEMLRVFGEPISKKRTERSVDTVQNTLLNNQSVQHSTDIEHELALEKLKNEHLSQQVSDQKKLIENYQQQIAQLNKTLDKANASIQDFAQVRLLEFKKTEADYEPPLEQQKEKTDNSTVATVEKKKRWWAF